MTKELVFDYDYIVYRAGFAAETRTVEITHTSSGRKKEFKNKTEFWGRKKNEIGGWLGEQNEQRIQKGLKPFTKDEFDVQTVRVPEPLENALHLVKTLINGVCNTVGGKSYYGYVGKGDTFRKQLSTILEYKGQRTEDTRPLMKDEIVQYIHEKHRGHYATEYESDDHVVMDCYRNKNRVLVSVDKDAMGSGCLVYNPDKPEQGIVDTDCLGELWIDEKGDIRGYGRKFFYYQWAYGDPVDHYYANGASDIKWGSKSAHDVIVDCTTDEECFKSVLNVYKYLYPEPKEIVGWRGDTIRIDHLYVANEIWNMARMRRSKNDNILATDVWKKYGMI